MVNCLQPFKKTSNALDMYLLQGISTFSSAPPDHQMIHLSVLGVPHPSLAHPPLLWAALCQPSPEIRALKSRLPGQKLRTI